MPNPVWNKKMANRKKTILNFKWNITYIVLKCLWVLTYFSGGYALIPVSTIEKGFLPSGAWLKEAANITNQMLQEATTHQDMKENVQPKFANHYLVPHLNPQHPVPQQPVPQQPVLQQPVPQQPVPQQPVPINPWSPSMPSSPPTPPPQYSVTVSIQQPEALVLQCHVQEPLEHISWFRYPCPNRYSSDERIIIADGTVVSNSSLYGVRIIGQNGIFISELALLQNPLDPGTAGLYRCEAWPHGTIKDYTYQQSNSLYHDEFIIGGQAMLKTCFENNDNKDKFYYNYQGAFNYNQKRQKSYRSPRNISILDISNNEINGY